MTWHLNRNGWHQWFFKGLLAAATLVVIATAPRMRASTLQDGGTPVTFTKDVAPIFREKCEACHRAEGMAPMSLTNFAEVRPWVRSIRAKVAEREMPPWFIDKTVGIQEFANDRSLTDRQIDTILRWVDAGSPMGDPSDMPPPARFSSSDWEYTAYFGRPPDLVVRSPRYVMPAVSQDRWWQPLGETSVPEDRWVAGTETRPAMTSRKVVHHAVTKLFQKENRTFLQARDSVREGKFDPSLFRPSATPDDPASLQDPSFAGVSFSEWAVGKSGELYSEEEAGQFLRAGARIGWSVHLSASGKDTDVMLETAFWFYPKGTLPKYRAMVYEFGDESAKDLEIPPNKVTRRDGYSVLPAPAIILNFQPHMHLRGKAFAMEAIFPDGHTEMLSYVSKYSFNWHVNYIYAKDSAPVLPKGTVIHTIAWHDNTAATKSNPDPTQWVTYGERSVDEMGHANEVVLFITDEDYQRITAERRQSRSHNQ